MELFDTVFYDPTRHLRFYGFLIPHCIAPLVFAELPLGDDFNLVIIRITWFRFVHISLPFLRRIVPGSMFRVMWMFSTPLLLFASASLDIIYFACGLTTLNGSRVVFL